MKKLSYFLILLNTLVCVSCKQATEIKSTRIEDSLIYIRGESSEQPDSMSSATGFVIARDNSWLSNKYFALTAAHSVKSGQSLNFKAIPFRSAKKIDDLYTQEKQFEAKIYTGSENESNIDVIANLKDIDVSIISFSSIQELPIPLISSHNPISKEKLKMHGFIRCIRSSSQNKFFSYHSNEGEIADSQYIKEVEPDTVYSDESKEFIRFKEILIKKLEDIDKKN
jgi:hypothetical protein